MILKTVRSGDKVEFDYEVNTYLDKGFKILDLHVVHAGMGTTLVAFLTKEEE